MSDEKLKISDKLAAADPVQDEKLSDKTSNFFELKKINIKLVCPICKDYRGTCWTSEKAFLKMKGVFYCPNCWITEHKKIRMERKEEK